MTTAEQPVSVRRRRPTDIPELAQILVRVHALDGYPVEGVADPEAWIIPPRELAAWVATLESKLIGHISLTQATEEDDAAQLWVTRTGSAYDQMIIPVRLFVDPPHRTRGAGRQLMLAAYQHATVLGKRMVFDVMLKDRDAIRLYDALGCERLGTIFHQHSDGEEEAAAVYAAPALSLPAQPSQERTFQP